jgi:FixJ family two-component response regulator
MNPSYLKLTKRLSEVLPESVFWLSNRQLCQLLNISESTRKRDHGVLSALGVIPVSWKNRTGYDREKIEVFWEFRQLHSMTDRDCAIAKICETMRLINERQGQGTGTTTATTVRTA